MASFDDLKLTKLLYKDVEEADNDLEQNEPTDPTAVYSDEIVSSGGTTDPISSGTIIVEEEDGSPSVEVSTIIFGNGSVTDNGDGSATVSSGGGGGTPGGADTNVQFNDAGAFGGNANFTFNKLENILKLEDSTELGYSPKITGGISNISLVTSDRGGESEYSGEITIQSGNVDGSYGYSGPVNIKVGDATNQNSFVGDMEIDGGTTDSSGAYGSGGDILIRAGHSGSEVFEDFTVYRTGASYGGRVVISGGNSGDSNGGGVFINAGSSRYGTSGEINLDSPQSGDSATGTIYLLSSAFQYGGSTRMPNVSFGGTAFGGGVGVIAIKNRTTAPSSNPSGGGILYVESGSLKYRGSGGTTTDIAPA
jgi:hypothetical protein